MKYVAWAILAIAVVLVAMYSDSVAVRVSHLEKETLPAAWIKNANQINTLTTQVETFIKQTQADIDKHSAQLEMFEQGLYELNVQVEQLNRITGNLDDQIQEEVQNSLDHLPLTTDPIVKVVPDASNASKDATIRRLKAEIKKLQADINLFQYQRQNGGLK